MSTYIGNPLASPLPGGVLDPDIESTITLTPAQILNMDNTSANAVQLIPPQGPKTIINVRSYTLLMQFNSAAYTTGTGNLGLYYNGSGGNLQAIAVAILASAVIKGIRGQYNQAFVAMTMNDPLATGVGGVGSVENVAVVASLSTAVKYLAGNSSIIIKLRWNIQQLAGN